MSVVPPDLVTAASAARRAAIDGDVDSLHEALCRLRAELHAHLHRGGTHGPGTDPVLRDGYRRLLALVDEILFVDAGPGGCNCLFRATELDVRLQRQVRLEDSLARHPTVKGVRQ